MRQDVKRIAVAAGIVAMMAGSAWAAGGQGRNKQGGGERHPVLQTSIRQLQGVKSRLQDAPTDFGGHKEAAIDAINHAISELNQAIQVDKK